MNAERRNLSSTATGTVIIDGTITTVGAYTCLRELLLSEEDLRASDLSDIYFEPSGYTEDDTRAIYGAVYCLLSLERGWLTLTNVCDVDKVVHEVNTSLHAVLTFLCGASCSEGTARLCRRTMECVSVVVDRSIQAKVLKSSMWASTMAYLAVFSSLDSHPELLFAAAMLSLNHFEEIALTRMSQAGHSAKELKSMASPANVQNQKYLQHLSFDSGPRTHGVQFSFDLQASEAVQGSIKQVAEITDRNEVLISLTQIWRCFHSKDVMPRIPAASAAVLHAMLRLLCGQSAMCLSSSTQDTTLSDRAIVALYGVSCELVEHSGETQQAFGLVVLYRTLCLASSSIVLGMTPSIHTFLLQTLKCSSAIAFHHVLAIRCLSTVITATTATKASLYFANELIASVQSSVTLSRKYTTGWPIVVALFPFLQVAEMCVLICNQSALLRIHLTVLNMWHLPSQMCALDGLSVIIHRLAAYVNCDAAKVIVGEMVRVQEFYDRGRVDISSASSEEVKSLQEQVKSLARTLRSAKPDEVTAVLTALEATCQTSKELLLSISTSN